MVATQRGPISARRWHAVKRRLFILAYHMGAAMLYPIDWSYPREAGWGLDDPPPDGAPDRAPDRAPSELDEGGGPR